MGRFVLTDARLFTGGADLSGSGNKIEVKTEREEKDVTNYRSGGWKEVLGGLAAAEIAAAGQWEAGDSSMVDDAAWAQLGGVGPWSAGPGDATVGALAYFTKAFQGDYMLGGAVGDVAPWQANAKSAWPLVRGQFAHPPATARTSTGSGTGVELAAAASGQHLYAALHVLSASGTTPSIAVAIESDADNTFASATSRITFDAASAVGGQILRTAGPITDIWYRATWTISGTSPSFMFVVALGIA